MPDKDHCFKILRFQYKPEIKLSFRDQLSTADLANTASYHNTTAKNCTKHSIKKYRIVENAPSLLLRPHNINGSFLFCVHNVNNKMVSQVQIVLRKSFEKTYFYITLKYECMYKYLWLDNNMAEISTHLLEWLLITVGAKPFICTKTTFCFSYS